MRLTETCFSCTFLCHTSWCVLGLNQSFLQSPPIDQLSLWRQISHGFVSCSFSTDSVSVFRPLSPCFVSFISGVLRHSDPLPVPSSRQSTVCKCSSKQQILLVFAAFLLQTPYPSLWLRVDRDLRHESLPGDPWHLAIPLLCMQGMLARCTAALMKRNAHWLQNFMKVWQTGVLTKESKFEKRGVSKRSPEEQKIVGQEVFYELVLVFRCEVCTAALWDSFQEHWHTLSLSRYSGPACPPFTCITIIVARSFFLSIFLPASPPSCFSP